jgi:hypothetical protein
MESTVVRACAGNGQRASVFGVLQLLCLLCALVVRAAVAWRVLRAESTELSGVGVLSAPVPCTSTIS